MTQRTNWLFLSKSVRYFFVQSARWAPAASACLAEFEQNAHALITGNAGVKDGFRPAKGPS